MTEILAEQLRITHALEEVDNCMTTCNLKAMQMPGLPQPRRSGDEAKIQLCKKVQVDTAIIVIWLFYGSIFQHALHLLVIACFQWPCNVGSSISFILTFKSFQKVIFRGRLQATHQNTIAYQSCSAAAVFVSKGRFFSHELGNILKHPA